MDTPPMSIKQEPQQLLPHDDDFEDSRHNLVSWPYLALAWVCTLAILFLIYKKINIVFDFYFKVGK